MAARKIDVDDEVFAFLEREAQSFVETTPNDVLRRLLLGKVAKPSPAPATGLLLPLIDAGKLKPGDRLVHHKPRKRVTFYATVTADGFVQIDDGQRFDKPSPALKAYLGQEINGWEQWVVERTGRKLKDLQ